MNANETATDRFFGRREVRPVGAPVVPLLIGYIKKLGNDTPDDGPLELPASYEELANLMGVKKNFLLTKFA